MGAWNIQCRITNDFGQYCPFAYSCSFVTLPDLTNFAIFDKIGTCAQRALLRRPVVPTVRKRQITESGSAGERATALVDPLPTAGSLLRRSRERCQLTLAEVSSRCGIGIGNLSRIERGERTLPRGAPAERLFEALGLDKNSDEKSAIIKAYLREFLVHFNSSMVLFVDGDNGPNDWAVADSLTLNEAAVEIGRISTTHGIKNLKIETLDGQTIEIPINDKSAGAPRKIRTEYVENRNKETCAAKLPDARGSI